MKVTLVIQGAVATRILEQLVAQHVLLRESAIHLCNDGKFRGGCFSTARTILVLRHEPVVVLAEMEAEEPEYMEERREMMEELLGEAGPSWAWRLILWVPEVEMLFFQDERLLLELVRPAVPTAEQLRRARATPRQVLSELLASVGADTQEALFQRLAPLDLSALWKLPELRVLEDFLLERLRPRGHVSTR